MIPVQLTIQGLYSYQEKQTIDFTRLTSANLFGIFGPVGSGKSSVLEAITFAIYGRTDRLNLSGDNRYYNMMNLKSDEMLIDFIFETGEEQSLYRATVKSRRNSKKFDDVKTPDRAAYQKKDGEWIPIPLEALEEAVGLNYDNFKRTIIIPQGRFQEFLQLGTSDRTRMMKELFNLGKFEFYYQVASLEKKNDALLHGIEGQLQGLQEISPEQLKAHEERLAQLKKESETLHRVLAEQRLKEEKLRALQKLIQQKEETGKERAFLRESAPIFEELEKKIVRYEQGVNQFKHLLELQQQTLDKKKQREETIRLANEKLTAEEEGITREEKILKETQPAYEKREELKRKSEELLRLVQVKMLENSLDTERGRFKNGSNIWQETTKEFEDLKEEKAKQEEELDKERRSMPDLALLATVRAWYTRKQGLDQNLAEAAKEVEQQQGIEKENRDKREELLSHSLFEGLLGSSSFEEQQHYLGDIARTIQAQQQTLAEQEKHLLVRERLAAYSQELEEGKPCPLCGSVHHPERYGSDNSGKELQAIQEQKAVLDKQTARVNELERQLLLLENRHLDTLRQLKEREAKLQERRQQVDMHQQQFAWAEYQEENVLNEAFKHAEEVQASIKQKETVLRETTTRWEKKEKEKDRFREALDKIKETITRQEAELQTLYSQLRSVRVDDYREISPVAIEEESKQLLSEHDRLEKTVNDATTRLQEHRQRFEGLKSSLSINQQELQQEETALFDLQQQLDERLASSPFETLPEVKEILATPFDIETEKQRLQQFRDQLLRNKNTMERIEKEIGSNIYNSEEHQQLQAEINRLSDQATENSREQGNLEGIIKKLASDLATQSRLHEEKEKLTLRAENLRTMKSLFKASGFVEYISSVYLQNLCNAANDRFYRLTRQQLSLELTGDNNFQVRDFLNGGKVRSVKTLSGGQTFQASLSLALALADNIQKITRSHQNFFFLDEGFGSLDKESLDIVFDTLKSLRSENRVVGVISHVEEMQQEIDVHLRVENHPERGSLIHRSWEE